MQPGDVKFKDQNGDNIIDNQDMTMNIIVLAGTLTTTQLALLNGGLLIPRPEGVLLNGIFTVTGGPKFGLDYDNSVIAGLDVGTLV